MQSEMHSMTEIENLTLVSSLKKKAVRDQVDSSPSVHNHKA